MQLVTSWARKHNVVWAVLIVVAMFAAPTLSFAEHDAIPDLSEVSLEQLGEIKVYSASLRLQPSAEAPSSVTVISADDIQQHGYRTLGEILQTVRGFFVTYDRNYTSLGVRGFARPGDFNTRILLLVDGHRLNDNVYDEAMIGSEFPLDVDLIQRVEIVRGPVSSLYGSNALVSVVNIITKRGGDLEGFDISSEAGSFNTYKGRVSYGRKLREVEFLVSGTFFGSRGHNRLFYPEFNTPASNNGIASHVDDDQSGTTLTALSFRDFALQAVFGTREKGIPTASYGTIFNNPGTRTTDSHDYVDLRYHHSFPGSLDLLSRTFYDRYVYQGLYLYSSPPDPKQISPNLDFAEGKWWGGELRLTKPLLRRHRITAGGEYRDNVRQDQSNYSLNPYDLLADDKRKSIVGAFYIQDELTISNSLLLNAGIRYDYYSSDQASATPRVALIYHSAKPTVFKFMYGEAFRVPNVYEKYYAVPPNLPNSALKPERIRTGEFVWEQGLAAHLWFSTSVFYNIIDGLISQEAARNNLFIFRNRPKVESRGAELEVKGQVPGGIEGTCSYSFQETEDSLTEQFLNNSPRHLVKINLTQPLLDRKLFASFDAQYRSRMKSLTNTPVSPFSLLHLTILGRALGPHFDLSASIYNLLDKRYFDPSSGETLQPVIEQDGRSFRIKMTWHWWER